MWLDNFTNCKSIDKAILNNKNNKLLKLNFEKNRI